MAATQPLRLQPSSPRVVDYAEDSCRFARKFGEGKTETKLAFESDTPDDLEMIVIGRPLKTYQEQISARFLSVGGKPFSGHVNRTVDTHQPAIMFLSPSMMSDEFAAWEQAEEKRRPKDAHVRPPALNLAEAAAEKAERARFTATATE